MKYLDMGNCFQAQKEEILKRELEWQIWLEMLYIPKGWSKILIGKTYWKVVALLFILCELSIIQITDTDSHSITIKNGVYKKILGEPTYTQVVSLTRGK